MKRKVLLVEPNYKNKYPPMPLMKLATYYRRCGDDVRFFKGDLKKFVAELLAEQLYTELADASLARYFAMLVKFIRLGKYETLEAIPSFEEHEEYLEIAKYYRDRFKKKDYPRFDIVCVTTLFTFYWAQTIDTINFCKQLVKKDGRLLVGGIAATILPEHIEAETGIRPHVGLLDRPGVLDAGNTDIIDELPLDYSILEEIDYKYPAGEAYFAYMTRGCIRNCAFCAVKTLEPRYKEYISIKQQLVAIDSQFGKQRNLLLMDNNVFASARFFDIIDEIKECGYGVGASYVPDSEYVVAIKNIAANYNVRAYTRKVISLYDKMAGKLSSADVGRFYIAREERGLLYEPTATREAILEFDKIAGPIYKKHFHQLKRKRSIDFNQGVDARLVTDEKMAKLAEIAIDPLRIAFDHYEQRDIYVRAIESAARHGITHLSNYLLYNFKDRPEHLYYRMKINVELCERLNVVIYSFPMKYHPIRDPEYFRNRNYIGEHWNRKFIRAVQAVLNATKGKIGKGKSFFEEAFGATEVEFWEILWMPEAFIISRFKYKDNLTREWREKFHALGEAELAAAKAIIALNDFSDDVIAAVDNEEVAEVLRYYQIKRDN